MAVRWPAAKTHKYRAKPKVVGGHRFDSTKEANRYLDLLLLMEAGEIRDLELQPTFELYAPNYHNQRDGDSVIGRYRADFKYYDTREQKTVIEDVKSLPTRTALYRWKIKHLRIQFGIEVQEV